MKLRTRYGVSSEVGTLYFSLIDGSQVYLENLLFSIVIFDLECTKVVKHGERHVLLEMESPIAAEKAIIILP